MRGKQKVMILSTLAILDCLFGGVYLSKHLNKSMDIGTNLMGRMTLVDTITSFDKDIKYDVYDTVEDTEEIDGIALMFDAIPNEEVASKATEKGLVSATSTTKSKTTATKKTTTNRKKSNDDIPAVNVAKASKGACVTSKYTGTDVAKLAAKSNGKPYVMGGTSLTKGADCSGFTMTLYQHFGVKLNRVARDQINNGMEVKFVENGKVTNKYLKAGDLLLFTQKGSKRISHVALYMGNGKIIHAKTPAQGIGYSKWNMNGYMNLVAVRRIFC